MRPFADASFLVALCSKNEQTPKARAWSRRHDPVVRTTRLGLFEAENSVRVMRLAGKISEHEEFKSLEMLKRFVLEGFIELWEVPVKRLFPAARRLSQHHTKKTGYGAMDIVHVASAQDMGATVFLSFDQRQRHLTEAEGMAVQPK
jgi:predicted nucleic acid-binding protein